MTNVALTVVAFFTGLFIAWQAWETRKAATAAVRQSEIARQQLVGTLGAVLNCTISLADIGVSTRLMNAREVDARHLEGTVKITPVTLPDLTPLDTAAEHRFDQAVVMHGQPVEITHGFNPAWLPPRDWSRWTDTKTLSVEVTFSWENGFGDRVVGHNRGVYLPRWKYERPGGSRSGGGGFQDGATVAEVWRDISSQLETGRNSQDPD